MFNKKYKTIGMVVAMDKEIKPFFAEYGKNIVEKTVGGYSVFECDINDKKVYLINIQLKKPFVKLIAVR